MILVKDNVNNAIMRENFCSKKILCYKANNIYEMFVSENLLRGCQFKEVKVNLIKFRENLPVSITRILYRMRNND